jgi:hypothetical protein
MGSCSNYSAAGWCQRLVGLEMDKWWCVLGTVNIQHSVRGSNFHLTVWDSDAPHKCQFFVRLATLGRCLTDDNLVKRIIPHNPICPLCHFIKNLLTHLLLNCSFAQQVWALVLNQCNMLTNANLASATSFVDWWTEQVIGLNKYSRRPTNSFVTIVSWEIWKERNNHIWDYLRLVWCWQDPCERSPQKTKRARLMSFFSGLMFSC